MTSVEDLAGDLTAARIRATAVALRQVRSTSASRHWELVETVNGREAAAQACARLVGSATNSVCMLGLPPWDEGLPFEQDHKVCNGAVQRLLLPRETLHAAARPVSSCPYGEDRHETRVLWALPVTFCLVDAVLLLISVHRDRPADALAVVRAPAVLAALREVFENQWSRALPSSFGSALLGEDETTVEAAKRRGRSHQVSRRRLLRMMLSGLPDEAIARNLGVSYRTAQRRIAELMAELGAANRFQAGMQAALSYDLEPHIAPPVREAGRCSGPMQSA